MVGYGQPTYYVLPVSTAYYIPDTAYTPKHHKWGLEGLIPVIRKQSPCMYSASCLFTILRRESIVQGFTALTVNGPEYFDSNAGHFDVTLNDMPFH